MKFYLHLGDACTLICRLEEDAKVSDLLQAFLRRYEKKHKRTLDAKKLVLHDKNGRQLVMDKALWRVLEDMEDVFVETASRIPTTIVESLKPLNESKREKRQQQTMQQNRPVFNELIERGEREELQECYRQASEYYERVLKECPNHKKALVHLMQLWTKVGRPQVAEKWCEISLSHYSDDLAVLVSVGKVKHAIKEFETAIQILNKAINIARRESVAEYPAQDVEIFAAQAMYDARGPWEERAVQLVMSVVEPEKKHFDGLLLYAKIAFDRGLTEDAVRVLLRLIMQKQEHEEVKKYLAACFEKAETLSFVVRELKSGPGLGSAYAFLAARIKDYGAVRPAIQLYERAVDSDPDDPSIALNYMHTLELLARTNDIITFAGKFLNVCKVDLIRNLNCKEIKRLVDGLAHIHEGGPHGWLKTEEWTPHASQETVEEIVETVTFSERQLDLLAALFTIVKVLFVGGALERAYQIVQAISPCCKASAKELHTTTIRNEAAYFNCIRQLLERYAPTDGLKLREAKPVYLCGDSHCLSGAWQCIQLRGEQHILIPALVTGCKVWHLRPESTFYPKTGFQHKMKSLPKKSTIIMNLGEIDCRTGIGLATEKLKYDSQAPAIKKTVSIYVQVIKDLVKDFEFVIYVHPVPPALDVTRSMVTAYNAVLKASIQELAKRQTYKRHVYWLDFYDDLLTPDKTDLKTELKFDDTHLAPSYITYLQQALDRCNTEV